LKIKSFCASRIQHAHRNRPGGRALPVSREADPSAWPSADGKRGITSLKKLREAQALGKASADVPTNFFLFFGSDVKGHSH
jgi:hypothetical protein